MKLDTLKTSLLAMVFAFGFNNLAQAGSDSDSDAAPHGLSHHRATHARFAAPAADYIEDRAHHGRGHHTGYVAEDDGDSFEERASSFVELFERDAVVALKGLYKMLECEESRLISGEALVQLLTKKNPHLCADKPCADGKSSTKAHKAMSIAVKLDWKSCEIARMITNLARSYNEHLIAKAAAAGKDVAADLKKTMDTFSDLGFLVNLVGQAGVQLVLNGNFTLDVMSNPCANPCAGLCLPAKPCCKSCGEKKACEDRVVDKGTEQVVGRIIKAFNCAEITECVSTLLTKVSVFGTKDQQTIIARMLSVR